MNECPSSRGVQAPTNLAALVIFWNSFRACQRSDGVPSSRRNMRPCFCHHSRRSSRRDG